ncbi:MAG: 50S ribosomal protein L31 [Bacillota bacterium]
MKEGIHPKYYKAKVTCVCGNIFETGSTQKEIRVEICSNCHPMNTGRQRIVDTDGRVEKFKNRFKKKS